jgi:hypothetical protein
MLALPSGAVPQALCCAGPVMTAPPTSVAGEGWSAMTGFGPAGLRVALAALLVLLCAAHCFRLLGPARAGGPGRDVALAQIALPGVMAWLFVAPDPPRAALVISFGVAVAWLTIRLVRGYILHGPAGTGPGYSQAVCCAAMCYVLAAPLIASAAHHDRMSGAMPMARGAGMPALTLAVAGAVAVAVVVSSRRVGHVLYRRTDRGRVSADSRNGALLSEGGRWMLDALMLGMLLPML